MTKRFVILSTVAILLFSVNARPLEDLGQTDDRIAGILARFPAAGEEEKIGLCGEVMNLGPSAVEILCGHLLPAGEGDDSAAQYALNALAVYVMRPGAERERQAFVKSLAASLLRTKDPTVGTFLISQLQLTGKKESVKPLAKSLQDGKLFDPAARALMTIGGPEAEKALFKALASAEGPVRITLVKTLGELRSRKAVRKLLLLADSTDERLRTTALFALANIGDPKAAPVLEKVRLAASPYERSEAPSLYLLYARRLVESGKTTDGLRIAQDLLKAYTGPGEDHVAAEALSLLVDVNEERALPLLLSAVDNPNPKFRGAALALATKIAGPEATEKWAEKIRTLPPPARAEVIAMLGERGDLTAVPAVRKALGDPEKAVRLAAIPAAAKLGGNDILPDLLAFIRSSDEDEVERAKDALLGYPGELVVPEAVRLMETVEPQGQSALLAILAEKGAREHIDLVFQAVDREDARIKRAAIRALASLAGEEEIPRLIALLFFSRDAEDINDLQDALVTAVLRNPDEATRASGLLEILENAPPEKKRLLLRILPRLGGDNVFQAIVREARDPNPQVQGAAVYALAQWPDQSAADELLEIITTTANARDLLTAVEGYVRIVGRGRFPAERKAGLLEDLLEIIEPDAPKRPVLRGLGRLRIPAVFRRLADHLESAELRETVLQNLLEIASSQSSEERWLSGHEAISILRRVQEMIEGAEGKNEAARIIEERLEQGGFVPLFNGRDLEGWKGLVADPPKRAQMPPEELEREQAAADARMRAHWRIEDGILIFDGKGESLATANDYGDFELLVDWKIERGGDSGIYLRGSPQVQIWDPEANPLGSGGLHNNQKGPNMPTAKADHPVGEWNTFRIIMIGECVTVYLNDRRVVNNIVMENYWERDKPIYSEGQIELQAHGNTLFFRNIYIREIPRERSEMQILSQTEEEEGFVPLFNGRDLSGWRGDTEGYVAENGKIVIRPDRGSGDLFTEKEYSDFILRFEFKLTPAANNGLGIRAPLEGDAAYAGMELQILEDGSPVYWNLRPYQYHGSIYGVVAAKRGFLRPVGEWNSEEVVARGRTIQVIVNGTTIVDADIDQASRDGTLDGRPHPGLDRESGHIGFLGHGSIVEFRNIRIKELK